MIRASDLGTASLDSTQAKRRLKDTAYPVLLRATWRAHRGLTVMYVGACVALGLVPVAAIFATGAAVGSLPAALRSGPGTPAAHAVEVAVGVLCVLFFLQQFLGSVRNIAAESVGNRLDARLRERVMAAVASPRTTLHLEDPAVLDAIGRATTVGTARFGPSMALGFGATAISGQVTGLAMAILLGTFRWWLTPMLVAVWLIVRVYVNRETYELYKVIGFQTGADRRGAYLRDLALLAPAAKEIRVFGLSGWVTDLFHDFWEESMGPLLEERRKKAAPLWLLVPLVVAAHGFALYVLIEAARHGTIGLRPFTVMLQAVLAVAILGNATRDDVVISWGAATIPNLERLEAVLTPSGHDRDTSPPAPEAFTLAPQREIRFEHVAFSYPGQSTPVFSDLNLVIPTGKSLAIVGNNGAGKTTIVKLLSGLVEPTGGRITVDGVDVGSMDLDLWRRSVSVVFQDFVHYEISARDNVRFGAWDHAATDEAIEHVVERAGLTAVFAALPNGLDTPLSRRYGGGMDLSGGEWQRVALARALWAVEAGASVLILDEPTANLDVRAEAAFYDRFLELTEGLSTIVISHRFSTVRQADLIAVIEEGQVGELGTHNLLLDQHGLYARMFRAQSVAFSDESSAVDASEATPQ